MTVTLRNLSRQQSRHSQLSLGRTGRSKKGQPTGDLRALSIDRQGRVATAPEIVRRTVRPADCGIYGIRVTDVALAAVVKYCASANRHCLAELTAVPFSEKSLPSRASASPQERRISRAPCVERAQAGLRGCLTARERKYLAVGVAAAALLGTVYM